MNLVIDATVAHLDLECAEITPGIVPGVNAEPVVFSILSAPTNCLCGVSTKCRAGLVLVDT